MRKQHKRRRDGYIGYRDRLPPKAQAAYSTPCCSWSPRDGAEHRKGCPGLPEPLPPEEFSLLCCGAFPVKRFGDSEIREAHMWDCPVPAWAAAVFGGTQ